MKKTMKKLMTLLAIGAMGISAVACSKTTPTPETTAKEIVKPEETTMESKAESKSETVVTEKNLEGTRIIHLISNTRGDGGNHDMAAKAVEKMRDEYGAEIKIVEMGNTAADVAKYLPTTLDACEDGWDYIVCGSAQMVEPVQNAAEEFPEVKFIVYDAEVTRNQSDELANVYSALFKQNESSYLAGVMAMGMSDSGKIGFIGGVEIPTINDFLVGYIAGARSVKESGTVLNSFIGSWNDLAKAKELASIQYQQGATTIFPAAGQAYAGIYEAGFQEKKMYLGCDVDRTTQYTGANAEMNEYMPTSVIKKVDVLIENSFTRILTGENIFGKHEAVGLKEDCVGIVENDYYKKLVPEEVKAMVTDAKESICDGNLEIPSAFGMTQDELVAYIENSN